MKKKILIISGIVLFAILTTIGILLFLNPVDKVSSAIDAIPGKPAIIIETNDFTTLFNQIKTENYIYQELQILFQFSTVNSIAHCYDSLICLNSIKNSTKGKAIICFDRSGGNMSQILYKELPPDKSDNSFFEELNSDLSKGGSLNEREYRDATIIEYKSKNGSRFFFSVKNHLLMLSFSSVLIEKSIDMLEDGKPINESDKNFAKLYESAGKKEPANIYINIPQLAPVIAQSGSFVNSEQISNMQYFSGWVGLDLNSEQEMIKLNGFIQNTDSASGFINLLNSQTPTQIKCREIIPDNTATYTAFAFNNASSYDETLNKYLSLIKKDDERQSILKETHDKTGINAKIFYDLIENEVCIASICPISQSENTDYYTIIGLNSQSNGILELENILSSSTEKTGKKASDYRTEISIDDKTKITCYELPIKNLPEILFGPLFNPSKSNYVCFVKNFMVFSETKEALHKFVYDALLNKTMSTSIEHNLFLENFSDKTLFFTYFSFSAGKQITSKILSDGLNNIIGTNSESFCKIGFVGYQINSSNDLLYNNLVIKHSANVSEKPQTVWESRLDNTIMTKPALVLNHNDNSKEILIQDEKNILYLLSNSGREVWRLQLDEQITGKIYQIDIYKNGKLQYLFSSANKIHIIDRLGNYIEKFPVTLRSQSTAPLALFDYENNKNYRILIPCADKKMYLYDTEGNIVKGWNFDETENKVSVEATHYAVGGEDYIVFHDDYKCYFLNRSGDSRLDILANFKFSKNNKIWYDNTASNPGFVTTDDAGTVWYINTDGTKDSIKIKTFGENHWFALEDVDADGNPDFVFADGKKLEVFKKSKKLIFSCELEGDISAEPAFYKFPSNQNKIGVVCKSASKIYLINSDGSFFNGFPLHGLTPFSIGYLNNSANKFNLLVGGPENLLYNYEVNEN